MAKGKLLWDSGKYKVVVIGVGAFAQGLASLAQRSGACASYAICLASRKIKAGTETSLPGLPDVLLCSIDDVIDMADMVVLAIPASSMPNFVSKYSARLSGKVVVDVSNTWPNEMQKLASARHEPLRPESKDIADDGDQVPDMECVIEGSMAPVSSAVEWLFQVLPTSCHIAKSFCNLSAYTLLHGDPLTEHMKSVVASDSVEAANMVSDLGRAMGLEMRVVHSLSYAATLEARQHGLLPTWQWPWLLMLGSWVVLHIYSFIRYNHYGGTGWQYVTMWITNKSVGWVGLWGMVYTYLPGVIVCYMQLLLRQPTVRLPAWIKAWMDARKQLGLLSLAAILLHLLLSTFLWMPSYYAKLWDKTDTAIVPVINGTKLDQFGLMPGTVSVPKGLKVALNPDADMANAYSINGTYLDAAAAAEGVAGGTTPLVMLQSVSNIITVRSRLNWIGEASTFLGIISGCLMGLIALTSVPCITPKINWREWRLLQSHSGWLAVLTATVHVILLGAPWWPSYKTDWPALIPTITLMSTLLPMMLLVLKIFITLPPLGFALARVRSGAWAKQTAGGDGSENIAVYAVHQH